nr:nucleotide-binding alpha-beta plait domain-containing protein [Tanacetum cinerariifolium]
MRSYRSKEDDVSRISTSIYVSNFPESFSAKDLFHSCKQYGHVVDTFIPFKRSKYEKRFGFVRFINVFNVERLASNLCTIWVDRSKFHANIARFHRAPLNNNKVSTEQKFGYNRNINNVLAKEGVTTGSSKSYVHAVKVKNMFGALECDSMPSMFRALECDSMPSMFWNVTTRPSIPRFHLATKTTSHKPKWVFCHHNPDLTNEEEEEEDNPQPPNEATDDVPRQVAWTTEEEIAMAKGWKSVSENSERPKFQDIAFPNLNQGSQGSSKRHKSSGSSFFNTESVDASVNLNNTITDDDEVWEI